MSAMRRGYRFLSIAALILMVSAEARADGDPEAAKKHFEAGRALRDANDCAKAVPEFEKSVAADKSVGGYYNLGFCQQQLDLRQDAYESYRRAKELASAKKDERLKEISGALATLLELPHIRLVLPNPVPNGLQVWVDGELVPASAYQNETVVFTKPQPVHDVRASAPTYDDFQMKVDTRELKSLELKPAGAGGPRHLPPVQAPIQQTHLSTQHWIGAGLFAAGAIAGVVGAIVAINFQSQQNESVTRFNALTDRCKMSLCSPKDLADRERIGEDNNEQVKTQPVIFLSLIISGAVAMGGGVVLFLTAKRVPDEPAPAPGVKASLTPVYTPTFQGLSLTGTF